jgi:hypothetical protein
MKTIFKSVAIVVAGITAAAVLFLVMIPILLVLSR